MVAEHIHRSTEQHSPGTVGRELVRLPAHAPPGVDLSAFVLSGLSWYTGPPFATRHSMSRLVAD